MTEPNRGAEGTIHVGVGCSPSMTPGAVRVGTPVGYVELLPDNDVIIAGLDGVGQAIHVAVHHFPEIPRLQSLRDLDPRAVSCIKLLMAMMEVREMSKEKYGDTR